MGTSVLGVLALGFSLSVSHAACLAGSACNDDLSALLAAEETISQPVSRPSAQASSVSISVDGETIVGTSSRDDENRRTDVDLEAVDIQVKFDGLGAERLLAVETLNEARVHTPDALIEFSGRWNYPAWIERGEILVYKGVDARRGPGSSVPLVVLPVDSDGVARWLPGPGYAGDHVYVLRVYDERGRFDETEPQAFVISDDPLDLPVVAMRNEGNGRGLVEHRPSDAFSGLSKNQLARTGIPVHGGAVTVYGKNLPDGLAVRVMGREIPVASDRDFVTQTILPAGEHVVDIDVREINGQRSIEFQRDINVPDNEWFYVGLADITVGRRFGDDSKLLAPAKSGEYDPVYKKGRLAFYLKGKIKGRYILTAALDTDEEDLDKLFTNLDEKDPRQLLRRLDPDDYYPVYGDDSIIKEDAPTSGKFYIRIDRGTSHVMWGNFKTRIDGVELARFERGLYGAKANLETETATSFGEPSARVQAFAAQPGTLPQRDEFQGTGGSVYFLRRSDINQGSEQVTIELRDQTTGLVVDRKLLREGADYTLDYVQGIIILSDPLASSTVSASAVLPSGLASYNQYLIVNYEYTPTLEDVDGYSYGGRAEAWLLDQFRFGATGYQDNTGMAEQSLVGADFTWRLGEKSYFQIEWAKSDGRSFGTVTSTDGGFIFNPIPVNGKEGPAEAWRTRLLLDMAEITGGLMEGSIGVGYEEREQGFNAPGRYSQSDERIIDAHAQIKPTDAVTLTARFDQVERQNGISKRDASAEADVRLNEKLSVKGGVLHSNTDSTTKLSDGTGQRTDIGARITLHGSGEDEIYAFAQTTVQRDSTRRRNDRVGAGFKADLTDNIRAEGEISTGTSGIGLLAALSWDPNDKDKYYLGYRLMPDSPENGIISYDPFNRDNGTLVVGMRRQLSDTMNVWTEHNYDMMGTNQGLIQAYGVELTPDAFWTVRSGVEIGQVYDSDNGDFERVAPSVAIAYKEEGRQFGSKLEVRFEDGEDNDRDRITWLGQANMSLQYDDNWRFLAKVDAAISDSDQSATLDGDYVEASVGWAYRPIDNDRLNALFKYTYLHDLPGPQQVNADNIVGGPKQRSHVLSADFIYDITERLSVGAKYGYRTGEVSVSRDERDFMKSTAHLGILRADYHVVKNWDVMVEGRGLWLNELEQVHYGVLAGIYRHIGDNLKVGVGYNFGKFSDDLTDLTLDDEGVFVNVIGKF